MAAIAALASQAAGGQNLGSPNPFLYGAASSNSQPSWLHDITNSYNGT
jgi:hypothetical protein